LRDLLRKLFPEKTTLFSPKWRKSLHFKLNFTILELPLSQDKNYDEFFYDFGVILLWWSCLPPAYCDGIFFAPLNLPLLLGRMARGIGFPKLWIVLFSVAKKFKLGGYEKKKLPENQLLPVLEGPQFSCSGGLFQGGLYRVQKDFFFPFKRGGGKKKTKKNPTPGLG